MTIQLARLDQELRSGITPAPLGVGLDWSGPQNEPACTYHVKDGRTLRVVWPAPPSSAQQQQAGQIIQAHDGAPTLTERMDGYSLPNRVLLALTIRASTVATAGQKSKAQNIIDQAATQAIQAIQELGL